MPAQGSSWQPPAFGMPPQGTRRVTSTIPAINVDKRDLVQIPPGSLVEICSDGNGRDGMLEVMWKGEKYALFRIDLNSRSESVSS
jgi:hypothetical protein